jgi:hypothetical protein
MDKALLDALVSAGWQVAGWALAAGLPFLLVYGVRIVRAKALQDEIDAKAIGQVAAALSAAAEHLEDGSSGA